jgi:UDP-N-acetylglucosamine 2-epimerase (non-hydrolysing)
MLSGIDSNQIINCVHVMVNQQKNWSYPKGYDDKNVSDKVIKVILGGHKGV